MSDNQETQIRMILIQLIRIFEVTGNLLKCGFNIKGEKETRLQGVKKKSGC